MEGVKSVIMVFCHKRLPSESQNPNKTDRLAEGKALSLFSTHITSLTWGFLAAVSDQRDKLNRFQARASGRRPQGASEPGAAPFRDAKVWAADASLKSQHVLKTVHQREETM